MDTTERLNQIEKELKLYCKACDENRTKVCHRCSKLGAEKKGIFLARSSTLKEVLEIMKDLIKESRDNPNKIMTYQVMWHLLESKITALDETEGK